MLVYFPMLNVPQSAWAARQLLYWDQLLVPTPVAVADNPDDHLDEFTRELMKRELVAYEFPENHSAVVRRVSDAFASGIDGSDVEMRRASMKSSPTFRLHAGKTSYDLLVHLQSNGLARKDTDQWWEVERTTAHEYMAVVSGAIAGEVDAIALTDSDVAATAVAGQVDIARISLLQDALPSPLEFDTEALEKLKMDHREELAAFREETERYAHLVAQAGTAESAEVWREQYRVRVEEAERTLARYLSGSSRAARLVKGPFGALVVGRAGALASTLQSLAGLSSGAARPDPDFMYSARVRRENA